MYATQQVHTNRGWATRLCFIMIIAMATVCTGAQAQTLIGSAGSGWQSWNLSDLNDSNSPFWDTQWGASQPNDEGSYAEKNVGFCLTSTGDCIGIGSAEAAPGTLSFWGTSYNAATDTGGQLDPKVYFKSNGIAYRATLVLNSSANPAELNEIGWFETNSTGTVIGAKHMLFEGTGPNENLVPAAIGSSVTFTPTAYFGYYFADVSEGNCYAYTLYGFNDPNCFGSHDFAIFSSNPGSSRTTMYVAGQDPQDCGDNDGDCNLTLVRVRPAFGGAN